MASTPVRAQPDPNGLRHILDVIVPRHHRSRVETAAALVVTVAAVVPRNRDVRLDPRSIARRVRRTEQRDRGHAHGGREVQRSGVAGHDELRASRQRQHVRPRRSPAPASRATRLRDDDLGRVRLARPPQDKTGQTVPLAQQARDRRPSRSGGHRLFGHAAPGLRSANGRRRPPAPACALADSTGAIGNSSRPPARAPSAPPDEDSSRSRGRRSPTVIRSV